MTSTRASWPFIRPRGRRRPSGRRAGAGQRPLPPAPVYAPAHDPRRCARRHGHSSRAGERDPRRTLRRHPAGRAHPRHRQAGKDRHRHGRLGQYGGGGRQARTAAGAGKAPALRVGYPAGPPTRSPPRPCASKPRWAKASATRGLIVTLRTCETTAGNEEPFDSIANVGRALPAPGHGGGHAARGPLGLSRLDVSPPHPACTLFEHPIYDLWLISCRTTAPVGAPGGRDCPPAASPVSAPKPRPTAKPDAAADEAAKPAAKPAKPKPAKPAAPAASPATTPT